jgi:3-methyladenine DNA glycosylase/8-oxoguanine DNA glycosylase
MASRFTIAVPRDYVLARDATSYGYFLLAPNHWHPAERVLERALALWGGGSVRLLLKQEGADDRSRAPTRAGRGGRLVVKADRGLSRAEREEAKRQLTRMLKLDEDEATIAAFHRLDPRWKRSGRGRLMRSPTLFEDIIKTVTSCNVNWPSTVFMNKRLCEVLGRGEAFPTPGRVARARVGTLRARCRVGYRDRRISELAGMFASGELEPEWFEDPATGDQDLHDRLLSLPGIGPYAAANIMQLLGRYHRLPLDSESVRHGRTVLGLKGGPKGIMKRLHRHYAPFGRHAFRSYWFELMVYYEGQRGPAWTWDRDTTGATFTASMLD